MLQEEYANLIKHLTALCKKIDACLTWIEHAKTDIDPKGHTLGVLFYEKVIPIRSEVHAATTVAQKMENAARSPYDFSKIDSALSDVHRHILNAQQKFVSDVIPLGMGLYTAAQRDKTWEHWAWEFISTTEECWGPLVQTHHAIRKCWREFSAVVTAVAVRRSSRTVLRLPAIPKKPAIPALPNRQHIPLTDPIFI